MPRRRKPIAAFEGKKILRAYDYITHSQYVMKGSKKVVKRKQKARSEPRKGRNDGSQRTYLIKPSRVVFDMPHSKVARDGVAPSSPFFVTIYCLSLVSPILTDPACLSQTFYLLIIPLFQAPSVEKRKIRTNLIPGLLD